MPIAAAFAPNYILEDFLIAARYYCAAERTLREGENISRLEEAFAKYMGTAGAVSFDSGRSGFWAILEAMGVGKDDEIILQAFTTVALSNVIRSFGAVPVYTDIDEKTLNMDPEKLEEKITPKTKAIIIQHTFGNPADISRILDIAKRRGVSTIEDCAHSLGAEYEGKMTGLYADAAFFSFGRDKVISAVSGGMVIARDEALMAKILAAHEAMPYPAGKEIRKKLAHPLITFPALWTYKLLSLGKSLMFIAQRSRAIDKAYTEKEKKSELGGGFAKKMPNALAAMACHQMSLLEKFNAHRLAIARIYEENLNPEKAVRIQTTPGSKNIFLWYTILVPDKKKLIAQAAKKDIILGDWFPQAVGPAEVNLEKAGYRRGSCPVAEKVSAHAVNLPTHHNIREEEAWKVAGFVNSF